MKDSMPLLPFFHQAAAGSNLTLTEAEQAMGAILEGGTPDAVIAGFLVALRMKGETADELAGFARAMRARCLTVDAGLDVVDIVGTGGDDAGTFNVSTVAAMVLASGGVKVAKHGNRAISGKVGSADVLEALGIRVAMTPQEAAHSVREIGLGFLFAPHLHPAMKYVQPVRRELKLRTVFNLLGPLANPAGATMQVIGAPSIEHASLMAHALAKLGTGHSYVVHGEISSGKAGLDEVSTIGPTRVYEILEHQISEHTWTPEAFGLARASLEDLAGGDATENAQIVLSILRGEMGPRRDIVIANAAAGFLAANRADSPLAAAKLAAQAIDSGSGLKVLEHLRKNYPASENS